MRTSYRTWQVKWNSLFVKLMASFIAMILLLLSFNVLSFTFFKDNIHQEIIKYNTLELSKAVDGYEKHFSLLKSDMVSLFFSQPISSAINHGEVYDLLTVVPAMDGIKTLVNNPLLFLKNMIIYSPSRTYTVESGSTDKASNLFVTRYASSSYPASFWADQTREKYTFRIFPAASFTMEPPLSDSYNIGTLFPIIARNNSVASVMIIGFLDAKSLYERFQVNDKDRFQIFDENGTQLFESQSGSPLRLESLPRGSTHAIIDGNYYFYYKGISTGFLYVKSVPIAYINSRMSQLTFVLIGILIASLILGLAVSVFLSIRFNSPFRRMIASMQSIGSVEPVSSKINELDWISETISHIVQTNKVIHSDLDKKNNDLKNYRYLNKVKRVHQGKEWTDPASPFYLILFEIANFRTLTAAEQEKASYYIIEYVNLTLSEAFKDTTTLQIEQTRILSLIFAEGPPAPIMETLLHLKKVLDRDSEYCLFTIAFRPVLRSFSQLAEGYDETASMLSQRKLAEVTQIITEFAPSEDPIHMPPSQDQELMAMLQAGEADRAMHLIGSFLRSMIHKEASAHQLFLFAKDVISKVFKSLVSVNIEIGPVMEQYNPYVSIQTCINAQELEQFLAELVHDSSRKIKEQNAMQDPVKDFVLLYIKNHFNQNISLETAANKLNMSRNYLSTYFREKTGMTFTDYLNELRIARAKELLSQQDMRVQEVAGLIGYHNANSFIRMFKKISGMTPGEYRRSLLLDEE